MAQNPLATINPSDAGIAAESAVKGDLQALSPEQRTALYGATCRSMGLNPLSRPFEYIKLNGKLTLYATRTATDQLRKINGVSITKVEKEVIDGVLTVTVHATDGSGRTDMEIGAVTIASLKGEALANAHMKALTKAKRRVTLSISGLGWMDESEVSSVPSAASVTVDYETGELHSTDEPIDILLNLAADLNITDAMLDRWAVSKGCQSIGGIPNNGIVKLSMALRDTVQAERFREQFGEEPPVEDTPGYIVDAELTQEVPTAKPLEIDGLDDLNAAADQVQAAAKARA